MKRWVAIVEDEPGVARAIAMVVCRAGWTARWTPDLDTLLRAIEDHGIPHALVLDHNLGAGVVGADVLAALHRRGIEPHTLCFSGAPAEVVRESFASRDLVAPPGFVKPDHAGLLQALASFRQEVDASGRP